MFHHFQQKVCCIEVEKKVYRIQQVSSFLSAFYLSSNTEATEDRLCFLEFFFALCILYAIVRFSLEPLYRACNTRVSCNRLK